MKRVRLLHLWLGMFIAPSLLLFAFTGALQVFGLHEDGAPALFSKLAEIHMKQSIDDPPPRAARPPTRERAPEAGPSEGARAPRPQLHTSKPLKVFFLFICLALFTSTFLGIYMAIRYKRDRRVVFGLLVSGCLVPALLLLL